MYCINALVNTWDGYCWYMYIKKITANTFIDIFSISTGRSFGNIRESGFEGRRPDYMDNIRHRMDVGQIRQNLHQG